MEKFIKRCIELAKNGKGKVSPNPLVGAVLFDDDGNIVSEGYHKKCGEAHAEVNAINSYGKTPKGLNLAVNLEPCSHYGKTPPCADLIIKSGIKKVVVGMKDPNPLVNGKGIKKLEDAGIEVIYGVLEEECKQLNEVFIKNQTLKKPFVTIKSAITLDGKIAFAKGVQSKITSENAHLKVHELRNEYDAIITGVGTVLCDNPRLTCRIPGGVNPARVIFDTNLKSTLSKNVFNDDGTKVYVCTCVNTKMSKINKTEIINCREKNGKVDISDAFTQLYKKGIHSILVEAGATLTGNIIRENLADKLVLFEAPIICGNKEAPGFAEGIFENVKNITKTNIEKCPPDIMFTGYFA